jgi:hypothetical protein
MMAVFIAGLLLTWAWDGMAFYNAKTGRWPNRDPMEEKGGLNLYGFVGNNSVDNFDRLGRLVGHIEVQPYYGEKVDRWFDHKRTITILAKWTPPTTGKWRNIECSCKPCQKATWIQKISRNGGPYEPDAPPWFPGTENDWNCNEPFVGTEATFEDHPGYETAFKIFLKSFKARLTSQIVCVEGADKGQVYGTILWGGDYDSVTDDPPEPIKLLIY